MRAAFALGDGRAEIREVPEPGEGELLVRTHYAAICGSDLHRVYGAAPPRPAGFGHESVGMVVRGSPLHREGRLVLVVPPQAASHAFPEYQVVPARSVVPLADDAGPAVGHRDLRDEEVHAGLAGAGRGGDRLPVATGGRVGFYGLPEAGDPDTRMPYAQLFGKAPELLIAKAAQDEPGLASFREAVHLITEREVDPDALISHEFPLERIEEAARLAHELTDGVVKATIRID